MLKREFAMLLSGTALQAKEEVDNVYYDDHIHMSCPEPVHFFNVSSHSLTDHHIIEEVNMHAPLSNYHEEMFSSNSESSVEYKYDN